MPTIAHVRRPQDRLHTSSCLDAIQYVLPVDLAFGLGTGGEESLSAYVEGLKVRLQNA